MFYKNKRLVVFEEDRQVEIIHDVHCGVGESEHAKAMAGHLGKNSTYEKVAARFFWYSMATDVTQFVRGCEVCQRQGDLSTTIKNELNPVPIPPAVMQQIGVDLSSLPEVDGYLYIIVCIVCIKAIKDKSGRTVDQFLYELMCRHGCFAIQINDQGREFVNTVNAELHRLTGVEQRVTSANHPQANGLVERQNRTIKNTLVKVLDENPSTWPFIIEGVLFAHRVSVHSSTKYSPFKLLYNRDPVLPIDVKHNLQPSLINSNEPFDKETFEAVLSSAIKIRGNIIEEVADNIKNAQKKQKLGYDRRHLSNTADISVGSSVWLRNNKRQDRKGGKLTYKWMGPYFITNITPKGVATLKNREGKILHKKYNRAQLKPFVDSCNKDKLIAEKEEVAKVEDEEPLKNYWDELPNELVERILLEAMISSSDICLTYESILRTCRRFQLIEKKGKELLPHIYIKADEAIQKCLSYNGMIKVSVRKIVKLYGENSGIVLAITEIMKEHPSKWRSAWLLLAQYKHSWYTVLRFYWKCQRTTVVDEPAVNDEDDKENIDPEVFWLRNELYNLKMEEKQLLLSKTAWLNDAIMDAAQRLICKTLGKEDEYQSVLNWQKKAL